jgi:tetratricopeptide (TPR) repeat protein
MLDCELYGLNPGMHHLINLIIHMANGILLFIACKKMTGAIWPSAVVAALFALHPINVESVAWVAERKNVLSTFFWILTILAYVQYSRNKSPFRYLLTLFIFMLGLLCKPMLVTLPFGLLLLDYWPLKRLHFKMEATAGNPTKNVAVKFGCLKSAAFYLFLEKVPFIILAAVSVGLSILSAKQHGILASAELVPIDLRLANALVSYTAYLGKLIWPQNLAVFYPYPQSIPVALSAGAGLALIGISFLVIRASKEKPYLGVGWFWYLGTLLPSIGLMQAGLWPAMADRWSYVPFIGLFIIIAWGGADFVERWRVKKMYVSLAAGATVFILMTTTWSQVQHWSNSLTLYQHAVDATADNHVAHGNLGATLYLKGDVNEATSHFIEALRIMPDYNEALNNLRISLAANGGIDHAIEKLKKLINIFPQNSGLYYSLGVMYGKKGELDKAIEQYETALSYHSEFPQVLFDMAFLYSIKGEYEMALELFKKTIEIQPDLFWAYYNIAAILAIQNRVDESISWLDRAINRGFRNWDFLVKDIKLKNIRMTSYYNELISKI